MTSNTPHLYRYGKQAYPRGYTVPCLNKKWVLSAVLSSLKLPHFLRRTVKTLSSVCLLIAQQHKDRKHFQLTDNTHGVLNVKVRVNIPTDQYFICDKANSGRIFIYRSCNNKNKIKSSWPHFFLSSSQWSDLLIIFAERWQIPPKIRYLCGAEIKSRNPEVCLFGRDFGV